MVLINARAARLDPVQCNLDLLLLVCWVAKVVNVVLCEDITADDVIGACGECVVSICLGYPNGLHILICDQVSPHHAVVSNHVQVDTGWFSCVISSNIPPSRPSVLHCAVHWNDSCPN